MSEVWMRPFLYFEGPCSITELLLLWSLGRYLYLWWWTIIPRWIHPPSSHYFAQRLGL